MTTQQLAAWQLHAVRHYSYVWQRWWRGHRYPATARHVHARCAATGVRMPAWVCWYAAAARWTARARARTLARLDAQRQQAALTGAWECIHRYEGAWNSNTGNGYYGGLQMDVGFQRTYGPEYLARWGTADNWPVWAQVSAAQRAHDSGRGYGPWPNTARACGLM